MAAAMDHVLVRRAVGLMSRIRPFLPLEGAVIDIGCGTGHNAEAMRAAFPRLRVLEADVVNMKVVGPPVQLIVGGRLPCEDGAVECATCLFVLHYPERPESLLEEARRVVTRRLIVLQSTFAGRAGRAILASREFVQGRGAYRVARSAGVVPQASCPFRPARFMTRELLAQAFDASGWRVRYRVPEPWPMTKVSRDLFVLEKR